VWVAVVDCLRAALLRALPRLARVRPQGAGSEGSDVHGARPRLSRAVARVPILFVPSPASSISLPWRPGGRCATGSPDRVRRHRAEGKAPERLDDGELARSSNPEAPAAPHAWWWLRARPRLPRACRRPRRTSRSCGVSPPDTASTSTAGAFAVPARPGAHVLDEGGGRGRRRRSGSGARRSVWARSSAPHGVNALSAALVPPPCDPFGAATVHPAGVVARSHSSRRP
jgi:hypothetical protein